MLDSTTATQGQLTLTTRPVLRSGSEFRGMRIARVELRNFGNYDGPATVFDFGCEGALVVGENGMGKSTAFDAIKVAFVLNPTLNTAASGKSERSVLSYYRGAYGNEESSEELASERCLRALGDMNRTMGILVRFETAKGESLSAVKLLYIDPAAKRSYLFIVAADDVSLDRDFPRFDSVKALRDRGMSRGWEVVETQAAFMTAIARGLGMEDGRQATRAFTLQALSSGLPTLESTTDFTRRFILPTDNLLESADQAVGAIEEHGRARKRIADTELQIQELAALSSLFDRLEAAYEEQAALRPDHEQAGIIGDYADLMQERGMARFASRKHSDALREFARHQSVAESRAAELTSVNAAIKDGNGDAIDALESQLAQANIQRDARLKARGDILEEARTAGLGPVTLSAEGWTRFTTRAPQLGQELEARLQEIGAERDDASFEARRADGEVKGLRAELEETERSRSALSVKLRAARTSLATRLGLSEEALPFLAELLQVQVAHADWEGAANRLLGGRARTILVPADHYPDAQALLNLMDSAERIRLQQVHHIDVDSDAIQRAVRKLADLGRESGGRALALKIDVNDDHPLWPWALSFLVREADHLCATDQEFNTIKGRAITRRGTISASKDVTEKDDRFSINDRKTYVLGWSVQGRIDALKAEIASVEAVLAAARSRVAQCDAGLKAIGERRDHLRTLEDHLKRAPTWADIDISHFETKIDDLKAWISEIESAGMKELRARAKTLTEQVSWDAGETRRLDREVTVADTQLESCRKNIRQKRGELDAYRRDGRGALSRSDYLRLRERLAQLRKVSLTRSDGGSSNLYDRLFPIGQSSIVRAIQDLREGTAREIDNKRDNVGRIKRHIGESVNDYLSRYDGERGRLSGNMVADNDTPARERRLAWRDRLREVTEQDLPAAREEADKFRQSTLNTQVLALRNKLASYDKEVARIASGINRIMAGNVYNPAAGTYAKLKLSRAQNHFVREFEGLMAEAVDGYTQKTEKASFEAISKIADYLRNTGTSTQNERREQVAVLANRWDAIVREIRHADDGTEELVRLIPGASVLSGGEKERLSVFLLAAATSCAFNAHDEALKDQALHTMLVDEAFSKSSDETASAAVGILDSFGLQIIAAMPMSGKFGPLQPVIGSIYVVDLPTNLQSAIVRADISKINWGNKDEVDEVPKFGTGEDMATDDDTGALAQDPVPESV